VWQTRPHLHPFRPRLLDALAGYNRQRFLADLGAGLTVGIVALPLALAFGIASGVKPEQGLITAIVAGFLISALGGSQVQIGGPAGAFIVIVYGIVERYGLTNLLISTVAAGVLMFLLGLFKLGVLVRYIPVSIVIGFTNGIAVLIAVSQLRDLLGLQTPKMPGDFFGQVDVLARHLHTLNLHALALGGACVALLALWARLPATARRVPAPIVALLVLTLLAYALHLPVDTIGSRFGELPRGLPSLQLPPLSWDSLRQLTIPIITIALLGSVESLLCARVADNIGEHKRHDPNQELMAQGVANVITPFFGGIPATGTIARTVTNVRAGAASPVAGMVHAAVLLLILLLAAPLASHVPLAVLAGILLFVAWNMFEGHQFVRLRHFSAPYRTLMLGSFVLTIVFDLTVAVEVGLVLACVFFIWRMGTLFSVKPVAAVPGAELPAGVQAFELYGSLFFGAVGKIEALPEQLAPGTRAVVLDMQRLISMDTSGLDALEQLHRTLKRQQVALVLANVNAQPLSLMRRGGFEALLGAEHIVPSLAQALQQDPG
jgi:sulfate permease, SulP family